MMRPAFERYRPGRKDSRVAEAQAMLRNRRTLAGLDAFGLACSFNLKTETAAKLIELEALRRAAGQC